MKSLRSSQNSQSDQNTQSNQSNSTHPSYKKMILTSLKSFNSLYKKQNLLSRIPLFNYITKCYKLENTKRTNLFLISALDKLENEEKFNKNPKNKHINRLLSKLNKKKYLEESDTDTEIEDSSMLYNLYGSRTDMGLSNSISSRVRTRRSKQLNRNNRNEQTNKSNKTILYNNIKKTNQFKKSFDSSAEMKYLTNDDIDDSNFKSSLFNQTIREKENNFTNKKINHEQNKDHNSLLNVAFLSSIPCNNLNPCNACKNNRLTNNLLFSSINTPSSAPSHLGNGLQLFLHKRIFNENKPKFTWQYYDNNKLSTSMQKKCDFWYDYDPNANNIVEEEWQKYIMNRTMTDIRTIKSGIFEYIVDFYNWRQINITHQNHTIRNIRRIDENGFVTANPFV